MDLLTIPLFKLLLFRSAANQGLLPVIIRKPL